MSCTINFRNDSEHSKTEKEHKVEFEKQIEEIGSLKKSMVDYMEKSQTLYTIKDIEECERILTAYILAMDETKNKSDGMAIVKTTIIKLNNLNERCNAQLIETSEREQIASIIIGVGNKKGYNSLDEDITEYWRLW